MTELSEGQLRLLKELGRSAMSGYQVGLTRYPWIQTLLRSGLAAKARGPEGAFYSITLKGRMVLERWER